MSCWVHRSQPVRRDEVRIGERFFDHTRDQCTDAAEEVEEVGVAEPQNA